MNPDKLIDQWRLGLRISHRAHYEAAKYYERLHLMLGMPTVVISALLGTTVFTHLQDSGSSWVKFVMAVLSITMIALSSLQTFFRYSERAERHKTAALLLGVVRRELEQQLVFAKIDETFTKKLREKWDSADRQAPMIPTHIYEQVQSKVVSAEAKREPRSDIKK